MISDFGIGVIHFDQSVRQIKLMQIFWNIETLLSHEKNDFSNTFTLFDFFFGENDKATGQYDVVSCTVQW